ncbi:MAG TPA: HEAT repeat domain-containing protein, partial [Myxococcota bacterium]|nr:HEAT repeat domain-containing protein [Myxococcota bacterium]
MKPQEQERVLAALDSTIEEIRHAAVRRLAEFETPPLAPLLRALGDTSWRVRKAAGDQLASAPASAELVGGLLGCLASEDNAGLRNAATEVLVRLGAPALDGLLGSLAGADADVRKFAADILGEIGDARALEPLVARLADGDGNVRAAAAEALGRLGDARALEHLVGALGSGELQLQIAALDALDRLGAEVPWEALRGLAGVRPLRAQLGRLLGRCPAPEAEAMLLDGLVARGRVERGSAALALDDRWQRAGAEGRARLQRLVAARSDGQIFERLGEMVGAEEPQVRAAALRLLGWTGRPEVLHVALEASEEPGLRDRALEALLALGPGVSPSLLEYLDSLGRAALGVAIEALGQFGQAECLPRLVELCLHEDSEVAAAAQRALGAIGSPKAVAALAGLLGRSGEVGSQGAVTALGRLAERFHGEVRAAILPLLEGGEEKARADAAMVLCAMARRADVPQITLLATQGDPRTRALAVGALGRVGGPEVLERLRRALADEQPEVRATAARALGGRTGPEAAEALRVALGDADTWVVHEALAGLSAEGSGVAPEQLVPFAARADGAVALEAVRALNRLGWGNHTEAWLLACRHSDAEVAKEALRACERWPLPAARTALFAALSDARWDVRMAAV